MKAKLLGIGLLAILLSGCGVTVYTGKDIETSRQSGPKTNRGVRPEASVSGISSERSSLELLLYAFSPVAVLRNDKSFRLDLDLMWKGVPEKELKLHNDTPVRSRPTPSEEWPTPPAGIEAKVNSVVLIEADGSRHPVLLRLKSKTPGGGASNWQRLKRDGIKYSSAEPLPVHGKEDRWLEIATSVRIKGGSAKTIRQKWKLKISSDSGFWVGPRSA